MSIVRIGLAETKNFAEGYSAIFGKKTENAKSEKAESKDKKKKDSGKGKKKK